MKRIVVLSVLVVTALVVFVSPGHAQFNFFKNPMIGKAAVDFTLPGTDGKTYSLTQLRAGKPAIMFFWATWCPHCREQITALSQKADVLARKGIMIILIDLGEEEGRVTSYLERNNIVFPALLDEMTDVANDYRILGVPTFYYISADGIVKAVEHELVSDYERILLGE